MTPSLLDPLDGLRRNLLVLGGGPVRRLLVDRDLRVGLGGLSVVGISLALTAVAPLWTLALGPILLGVPHLVADLRYLVARPKLHHRGRLAVAIGAPLVAVAIWPHAWVGLLAALGALAVSSAALGRRWLGLGVGSLLYLAARAWVPLADWAVIHLHNAVAIGWWWSWRSRQGLLPWLVLMAIAAGVLWTASAGFPVWLSAHHGWSFPRTGGDVDAWLRYTAGSLPPTLGVRTITCFCFAQSVHYGLWLRLIPDDDRVRRTPRTFRASWVALVEDLGWPFLVTALVTATALALWGALDLGAARNGYLRLASFHAHLELAVAALFWVEGRSLARAASSQERRSTLESHHV